MLYQLFFHVDKVCQYFLDVSQTPTNAHRLRSVRRNANARIQYRGTQDNGFPKLSIRSYRFLAHITQKTQTVLSRTTLLLSKKSLRTIPVTLLRV